MVQYIQLVGVDTVTESTRIAPARSIAVDPEANQIRLHDGVTPGGHLFIPLDQVEDYQARLFNNYIVWPGGTGLTNLSANFTLLGAGDYDFQVFTELLVGVPIYIGTGASAITLTVFDSDNEVFRLGSASELTLNIPADSVAVLVKLTTGIVQLVNLYTVA